MGLHVDFSEFELSQILSAAEAHGLSSEPDHEVGDLQDVIRQMWRLFDLDQVKAFAEADAINEMVEWSGDPAILAEGLTGALEANANNNPASLLKARNEVLQVVLDAAKAHGMESESDMEIGDLQEVVRQMWGMMNPEQKKQIMTTGPVSSLIQEWGSSCDAMAPGL